MATITVEFDSDLDAKRLANVLRRNSKQDRESYNIKIIKREQSRTKIATPTGESVRLKPKEFEAYNKLSSAKRQKSVSEFVFFKANGTFRGSKPFPNSPYQTATPFFSNSVLGEAVFPGHTNINDIHAKLSKFLNDAHLKTGAIGDWRTTHSPKYGGFWSYRLEKFVRIHVPGFKSRNVIIYSEYKEAKI